ncbi:MAG TPA: ABC transporter permease [Pyrinomonadaceae bacterium]|nr:ABC transporter permease [Pyrinomonadaceae bacterium]
MGTLWQDARYGVRALLKSPGLMAVAVLALALGMGANTAIFSVVNAVLLRPLPYKDAGRLTTVFESDARQESFYPAAPANFLAWKGGATSFEEMAALSNKGWSGNLTGAGEPERLQGFQVTANLFQLLGVGAAHGRTFLPEEDRPGASNVVVLSHGLWQRRFGGDRSVVGRTLTINGQGYAVVGVMPPDFQIYEKADVWTPVAFDAKEEANDEDHYLFVMGRLRPGVTVEQARAEASAILRSRAERPEEANLAGVSPAQEGLVREVRPLLYVLFGAVGFVLLIACANVASLLLARAASRRKEIAIRTALGASRVRIVRQLLTESVLLALLGATLGLFLALWGVDLLVALLPEYVVVGSPRLRALGVDAWVLGYTVALSLATSLLFGLAPALQASKADLTDALKEGGRGGAGGSWRARLRGGVIVAEVALAVVLLAGAGLMIRTLWQLNNVPLGFDPENVLAVNVDLPEAKYEGPERIAEFYGRAFERVAAVPGVERVGATNSLGVSVGFQIEGRPPLGAQDRPQAVTRFVSPGYFDALRVPLVRGRAFTEADRRGGANVAVIDETLARRHFADEDPVGRRINLFDAPREIVGVVGAARYDGPALRPNPVAYLPYTQMTWSGMTLYVRSAGGDPASLSASVRGAIHSVDPDQPVYNVRTLSTALSETVAPQRYLTLLLGAFAAVALLLSTLGLYGVVSYSVAQRTQEIGIRMALGARPGDVLRMILRQGVALVAVGVAAGLAASLGLTRLMESVLFGVRPTDPLALASAALLLVCVALLACYVPARRATKVDPMEALRYE